MYKYQPFLQATARRLFCSNIYNFVHFHDFAMSTDRGNPNPKIKGQIFYRLEFLKESKLLGKSSDFLIK